MKSSTKSPKTNGANQSQSRRLKTTSRAPVGVRTAALKARSAGRELVDEVVNEGARMEARVRDAAQAAVRDVRDEVRALIRSIIDQLPPYQVLKEVRALRTRVDAIDTKLDTLASARGAVPKLRVAHKARSTH
jgi:hypothetical protein